MTFTEFYQAYLKVLWDAFQYDMEVFSKPWMYYVILIPALAYLVFFFIKWAVLTTPIWFPLFLILQPIKGFRKNVAISSKETTT